MQRSNSIARMSRRGRRPPGGSDEPHAQHELRAQVAEVERDPLGRPGRVDGLDRPHPTRRHAAQLQVEREPLTAEARADLERGAHVGREAGRENEGGAEGDRQVHRGGDLGGVRRNSANDAGATRDPCEGTGSGGGLEGFGGQRLRQV